MLRSFDVTDKPSTRHFLLERCQNSLLGGFAKVPDSYPDILHTFYSLAWLSMAGESGTEAIDPTLGLRMNKSRAFLEKVDVHPTPTTTI